MELVQRILFYGNSVVLGTLGANLRDCPRFNVTILLPPWPGKQRLEELKPDVIFFDLEADHPEAAFSMLDSFPDMLLVGISPDSNLVQIWSGRQLQELSTKDLQKMIIEHGSKDKAKLWNQTNVEMVNNL